jgi:hypothetical protein
MDGTMAAVRSLLAKRGLDFWADDLAKRGFTTVESFSELSECESFLRFCLTEDFRPNWRVAKGLIAAAREARLIDCKQRVKSTAPDLSALLSREEFSDDIVIWTLLSKARIDSTEALADLGDASRLLQLLCETGLLESDIRRFRLLMSVISETTQAPQTKMRRRGDADEREGLFRGQWLSAIPLSVVQSSHHIGLSSSFSDVDHIRTALLQRAKAWRKKSRAAFLSMKADSWTIEYAEKHFRLVCRICQKTLVIPLTRDRRPNFHVLRRHFGSRAHFAKTLPSVTLESLWKKKTEDDSESDSSSSVQVVLDGADSTDRSGSDDGDSDVGEEGDKTSKSPST